MDPPLVEPALVEPVFVETALVETALVETAFVDPPTSHITEGDCGKSEATHQRIHIKQATS